MQRGGKQLSSSARGLYAESRCGKEDYVAHRRDGVGNKEKATAEAVAFEERTYWAGQTLTL